MFEPSSPSSPSPPPSTPPGKPPATAAPAALDGRALKLLAEVRAAQRSALWTMGVLLGASTLLVLLIAGGLLGSVAPTKGQWLLVASPLVALGVALFFGLWVARHRVGDDLRTARHLAEKVPELSLDLLAAVELSKALGERHDFSPELARGFIRAVDARAARFTARAVIDPRPVSRSAVALVCTVLAAVAMLGWQGKRVRSGFSLAFSSSSAGTAGLKREPITGDIELTYRFPTYTGLEPRTVAGTSGEVSGPAGTEVLLKTRADRDVDSAALVVNAQRVPLTVKGRELAGSFVLDKAGQYHVVFLDGTRIVAEGPDMPVQVEADQVPQVRLTAPIDQLELDPDKQQVTVKYEASDDYGIDSLELVYRPLGTEEKRVPLKPDDGRTTRGQYVWDLSALKLKPGQTVSYYVEAKDNDAVAGAKKGVSHTQTLKLYSAAEHRREALARAEQLWERLVAHTADRLEGPDRAAPLTREASIAGKVVDDRASALAADMGTFVADLDKERDPPEEILSAERNVAGELTHDTTTISTQRRLHERFAQQLASSYARELGGRVIASIATDITHSEKNVLYLEALLDRQKMEALKELANELRSDRRELSRLLEDYQKTKDDKTKEALLEQMQELRKRMQELQERMAALAKGIRDEHMNAEALQEMMEERDLGAKLDEVEKLVREGKADEALKKMQELAMEMDEFLESLDKASDQADENADPELTEKFQKFTRDLDETAKQQEQVADKTKDLRDKYRQQAKDRIANQGEALKKELGQKLDELKKDYDGLDSDKLGLRFEDPRLQALQNLEHTKQALEASDFDLASDAADRLAEKAQQLAERAEDQKRLDEMFQNPAEARKESKQLGEKLNHDAKKAEEIASKLRSLFPQGQQMAPQDQQQLSELEKQQQKLGQKTQQLQQQMDEISERAPVFDQDAKQQLEQAGQRMDAAEQRLQGRDPGRGYGEQQGALQALRGLQQQMQQQGQGGKGKGLPLPMRGRMGHGRNNSDEKIAIPDEDPNQAPRDFRKDVMDAMKQGAPDRYKDQNKHYYEELVK